MSTFRYDIRELQVMLAKAGYSPGEIDGVLGPKTERAIVAFKRSIGFRPRPFVGPKTWAALVEASSNVKPVPQLPWMQEAASVMGLHEVRDKAELQAWLKSDGKTLGDPTALPWCFTGNVEILTEDGWQRFDELTAGRVYQVAENGDMSLTEYRSVQKEYEGPIDVVRHRSWTVRADPEHRWWGMWGTTGRAKRPRPLTKGVLADMTTQGLRIPYVQAAGGGCRRSDEELEFVAAFVSDGTYRPRQKRIVFEVSVGRKIDSLTALGPDHVYVQPKVYGPLTTKPLTVFSFRVPTWLQACVDVATKGLDRDFINSMNREDARAFLRGYRKYDGSAKRFHLYTSDAARRDDLIQIATMAGWGVGVSVKTGAFTDRPCYEVHIRTSSDGQTIYPKHVTQEAFSGTLYCVTVPEGRIVVREYGRGAVVTGNCGDFAETITKNGLPDEPFPGALGENPYWARNWALLGRDCGGVYGAYAVFTRGLGGHIGNLIGVSRDGKKLYIRGGNQSNMVRDSWLNAGRLMALRWPATWPTSDQRAAPVLSSRGAVISRNEA